MEKAIAEFGAIDILVNNAGIQHVAPIEEFPLAKWDAILAINLSAAFHTIRLALPAMKAQKWGRIINVASAHALVASPYKSAYVAAKHGIAGPDQDPRAGSRRAGHYRQRHLPGLRADASGREADSGHGQSARHHRRAGDARRAAGGPADQKFVDVDEVAAFSAFLASDAAASITGPIMPIDGGWTAH